MEKKQKLYVKNSLGRWVPVLRVTGNIKGGQICDGWETAGHKRQHSVQGKTDVPE